MNSLLVNVYVQPPATKSSLLLVIVIQWVSISSGKGTRFLYLLPNRTIDFDGGSRIEKILSSNPPLMIIDELIASLTRMIIELE